MLESFAPLSLIHFFKVLDKGNFLRVAPWNNYDVIWGANGLQVKRGFNDLFSNILREANYEEVQFPTIIDDRLFQKQPKHYRDLKSISFKIQGEDKYIRATSESQIAEYLSYRNPQKTETKLFQICTVFRKEDLSNTLPIIRAIEIEPFLESMTFSHDSLSLMNNEIGLMKRLFDGLCLPYIELIRPVWDTFPEALTTYAFDSYVQDLGWIQIGSIHNLGTSFTKYFKIHYKNKMLQQTSSGISGRALLTAMLIHFHDNKIYLPFILSQKQISIKSNLLHTNQILHNNLKDFKIHVLDNELSDKFLYEKTYNIPLYITLFSKNKYEIIDCYGNSEIVEITKLRKGLDLAISNYSKTLSEKAKSKFHDLIQNEDVLSIKNVSNNLKSLYDSVRNKDRTKTLLGWRFGNWIENKTEEMVFNLSNSEETTTSFYFGSNN